MNEKDLLGLWSGARLHIIVAQFAPTFLLTVVITALSLGGDEFGSLPTKVAAAGVLLASGILGAVAQYTSASEAQAIALEMRSLSDPSLVIKQIISTAWWTLIVKYVTPAIFTLIYAAILWQLFL
ncbi:hypothetical protein [Salinibacterium sp. SWN1162]|uniref:hypothetical protein n=1 Tax=Salinibacterium sp. SWN1162 TaxID=2792053 RepID=UPI0018CDF4F4|nr:hypothetical protein [Salinibacterium sp. SWN1162]MBH0008676.1 hypothetical protein [Salinibacterium sp. SWN1162]